MFDMLGNIVKNLFSAPATRRYPFEKREPVENGRGQITGVDAETCIYCGLCARKCPSLCITVDKATKTWQLNPYKCVICGVCVEACPKKCISMDAQYRTPVYHKDAVVCQQAPKPPAEPEVAEQPRELAGAAK